MEGRKDDQTKLRYDLIPPEIDAAMATVLTYGAAKYEDRNWERGMDWSRPYGALKRHMDAWWGGEDTDLETGMSHLWHAACCIAFLATYEAREIGEDDRPGLEHDPNGMWSPGYFEAHAEAAVAGLKPDVSSGATGPAPRLPEDTVLGMPSFLQPGHDKPNFGDEAMRQRVKAAVDAYAHGTKSIIDFPAAAKYLQVEYNLPHGDLPEIERQLHEKYNAGGGDGE